MTNAFLIQIGSSSNTNCILGILGMKRWEKKNFSISIIPHFTFFQSGCRRSATYESNADTMRYAIRKWTTWQQWQFLPNIGQLQANYHSIQLRWKKRYKLLVLFIKYSLNVFCVLLSFWDEKKEMTKEDITKKKRIKKKGLKELRIT